MEHLENRDEFNPNNIGELLSMSKDIETFPDKVYRSVKDEAAITDLVMCGVVRNKQSAGLATQNRWDKNVYWSRGSEGKYHFVQSEGYLLEASYAIAVKRQITIDDVTAIYYKNEAGEIENILERVLGESIA